MLSIMDNKSYYLTLCTPIYACCKRGGIQSLGGHYVAVHLRRRFVRFSCSDSTVADVMIGTAAALWTTGAISLIIRIFDEN